jgi:hypothetical protein
MSQEERLSEALHATLDAAQPSPALTDGIVERVSIRGRRAVRFNLRLGFAGAALVVVIALVPIALSLRSNGGSNDGGPSAQQGSAAPSAQQASAATSGQPAGPLAHFDRDGLAFDYPASWKASVSGLNEHYGTILDFLGTGSGLATCAPITPGPSDQFISGTECGTYITIGPGQVVVELSRGGGPGTFGPIDPADPTGLAAGGRYVTVGGLPAISGGQNTSITDADLTLDWTLSVPGELNSRYDLRAEIKNPGVDQMRAQVEALVASIRYSPPVPVLNPADAPRIAAIGLAQARKNDPTLACFPSVPNASATAVVTSLPGYPSLSKPLPVTCRTEIEPVSIGLWKLTLTQSWTAASDRSAGTLTTTVWLAPDGTPGTTTGKPSPSGVPYWQ